MTDINIDDIKIIPLFDQSAPGVWDDFMDIRMAARFRNGVLAYYDYPAEYCMERYSGDWRRFRTNFAFGAYNDDRMVGMIHGRATAQGGYIEGQYVLPSHQSAGLGGRLLSQAEEYIAAFSPRVDLVSTPTALPFYLKHGYRAIENGMRLPLQKIMARRDGVSVHPMFHCSVPMKRQCRAIYPDYDVHMVNTRHEPAFFWRDSYGNVGGFVSDRGLYVACSPLAPMAGRNLKRAFDQYKDAIRGR